MSETTLSFQYDSNESQRLDLFLVEKLPDYSRAFLQGLIKKGLVEVEDIPATKNGLKLEGRQHVVVTIPPSAPSELIPEPIQLDIIYEDENLLVVNKPVGMVVHPSAGHHAGTLIHAALAHAPDIEGVGGVQRPGLVHRLDMDTSGLIVLAKNDAAHQYLQKQFKDRKVNKTYLALVDGHPPTPTGRVEAAVGRDAKNRQRMAIVPDAKGKLAISEYKSIETFSGHTLLEVTILTGRTHQIRLHLAFLGCPVTGDRTYGHKKLSLSVERQMLHAWRMGIILPDEQKITTFEAPLPEDLEHTLQDLRKR